MGRRGGDGKDSLHLLNQQIVAEEFSEGETREGFFFFFSFVKNLCRMMIMINEIAENENK